MDTILSTNQTVEDLVAPFMDEESLLAMTQVSRKRQCYRTIVVDRKFGDTKRLLLSDNNLSCISVEINQLVNLMALYLAYNRITKLPSSFGNGLVNLKELNLAHNRLTKLPKSFGISLVNLTSLFLEGNQLTELPDSFGIGLEKLRFLYLTGNRLTTLPDLFYMRLINLKILVLMRNQLGDSIESTVTELSKNARIYLRHNCLTRGLQIKLQLQFGNKIEV